MNNKSGYLLKKGQLNTACKKRFFVLKDFHLNYYKSDKDKKPLDSIDLRELKEKPTLTKKTIVFEKATWYAFEFTLAGSKRVYELFAETQKDAELWIEKMSHIMEYVSRVGKTYNSKSGSMVQQFLNRGISVATKKEYLDKSLFYVSVFGQDTSGKTSLIQTQIELAKFDGASYEKRMNPLDGQKSVVKLEIGNSTQRCKLLLYDLSSNDFHDCGRKAIS